MKRNVGSFVYHDTEVSEEGKKMFRREKEQIVYVVFKFFRHLQRKHSAPYPGDGRETKRG